SRRRAQSKNCASHFNPDRNSRNTKISTITAKTIHFSTGAIDLNISDRSDSGDELASSPSVSLLWRPPPSFSSPSRSSSLPPPLSLSFPPPFSPPLSSPVPLSLTPLSLPPLALPSSFESLPAPD